MHRKHIYIYISYEYPDIHIRYIAETSNICDIYIYTCMKYVHMKYRYDAMYMYIYMILDMYTYIHIYIYMYVHAAPQDRCSDDLASAALVTK